MSSKDICDIQEDWFFGHNMEADVANVLNFAMGVIVIVISISVLVLVVFIRKRTDWFLIMTPILLLLFAMCYIVFTFYRFTDEHSPYAFIFANLGNYFYIMAHWVFKV